MDTTVINKNTVEVELNGRRYLQNYGKNIAEVGPQGEIYLDSKYNAFSKTTVRQRNRFLNKTSKEVLKMIESGNIVLTDLNRG